MPRLVQVKVLLDKLWREKNSVSKQYLHACRRGILNLTTVTLRKDVNFIISRGTACRGWGPGSRSEIFIPQFQLRGEKKTQKNTCSCSMLGNFSLYHSFYYFS